MRSGAPCAHCIASRQAAHRAAELGSWRAWAHRLNPQQARRGTRGTRWAGSLEHLHALHFLLQLELWQLDGVPYTHPAPHHRACREQGLGQGFPPYHNAHTHASAGGLHICCAH